jgi:Tfp pilus assembly protein PilZ
MTSDSASRLRIMLEYRTHDDFLAMLDKYAHIDSLFIPSDKTWDIATAVQIDIYIDSHKESLMLTGIVTWQYPASQVPKGRLAGVGVQLDDQINTKWQSYLEGRVPSILATFPGNSVPCPPILNSQIDAWAVKDQFRAVSTSAGDEHFYEAASTSVDLTWGETEAVEQRTSRSFSHTPLSGGSILTKERAFSQDQTGPRNGPNDEEDPQSTSQEANTVNTKRPLPNPHRWPPAHAKEDVNPDRFSVVEEEGAADLVPTKPYAPKAKG